MKKISVVIILCLSLSCFGDAKCDKAIKACEEVVEAQDKAIDNLKKIVHNMNEQLEEERSGIKWWQALIGGVLIGMIVTKVNK